MQKILIISALACALAACHSTYQGAKLGEDGALAGPADKNGIPYLLSRPKFVVAKDDAGTYSVTVTHVPDPTQRYTLRVDPTLLADTGFKLTWGENGTLNGLTGSVTDQAVPTTVAVLKLTADIVGSVAAAGFPTGAAEGTAVYSGCLGFPALVDAIECAIKQTVTNPATAKICTTAMQTDFRHRLSFFRDGEKDRGNVLDSLYAANPAQEECLREVAKTVSNNTFAAISARIVEKKDDAKKDDTKKDIQGLLPLAEKAYQETLTKVKISLTDPLPASGKTALIDRIAIDKGDSMRQLMAAVARYENGHPEYFNRLFSEDICDPKKTTKPCPDSAVVKALSASFLAAGLKTMPPAEQLDLISRGPVIEKALRIAAGLPPDQWASRRIADLDRQEAAAIREAIRSLPPRNPETDKAVNDIQEKKADVVGLSPEFVHLRVIRKQIETLSNVLSETLSKVDSGQPLPSTEEQLASLKEHNTLRAEAMQIEKLIATRISAIPGAPTVKVAAQPLPPEIPWVAESCVSNSTSQEDWKDLEGAEAPEFVILLRRAGGNRKIVDPVGKGCGS